MNLLKKYLVNSFFSCIFVSEKVINNKNQMDMKTNFGHMSEEAKIMYIIDELGAKSFETGVTMKQIIEYGISIGATDDTITDGWHGYQNGDHKWWTKMKAMAGEGTEEELNEYNEPYLHRKTTDSRENENGRLSHPYVYWYDNSYEHVKNIIPSKKPARVFRPVAVQESFRLDGGRNLNKNWVATHQKQALKMYGKYPEVVEYINSLTAIA